MKKITYFLFLAVFCISIGCSSDDSSGNSPDNYSSLLLGKWKPIEQGTVIDGNEQAGENFFCGENSLSFYETGIYFLKSQICLLGEEFKNEDSGYWELLDNKLNIINEDDNTVTIIAIQTLNSNTLKLYYPNGSDITYTVYTKIQ